MRHSRWPALILGAAAFGSLLVSEAEASRVRRVGLADMAERAGQIFVGRCARRTVTVDAETRLPVTLYTFTVTDPIKGVSKGPVTFRVPGTPDHPFLDGMAVFEAGEEDLLILYPESQAGFSSAIGLDQGRFRIEMGREGNRRAANGIGNEDLIVDVPEGILQGRSLERRDRGPLDLEDLTAVLRSLMAGHHR